MMFTKYIDKIEYIHFYSNYEEYSGDPNYNFEVFALNHSIDINGELKTPYNSIPNIPNWIAYIEKRALSTQNKVVRSRYNDLLWSYKKQFKKSLLIAGNVRDKCELAISDYIYLAEKYILLRSSDDNLIIYLKDILYRGWNLSKQIKSNQQTKLIQLMIEIEDSINDDAKIGLWGFSFKKLINDTSIGLSQEQERAIIERIDSRIINSDSKDYLTLEYGIKMLLEYYKANRIEQEKYLDILEKNAHIKSNRPFENQNRFKNLVEICHQYQFKERKERAIMNYQYYGKDIHKYMVKLEESMEITPKMHQDLINILLDENPYVHFINIAHYFIFRKSKVKDRVEENKKNFFLSDLFPTVITNKDGVTIKALNSEDDKLYNENKFDWQINSVFFLIAIKNFIEKHQLSSENLKDLVFDEMLYKNQENTLLAAIKSLYDKDYFAMCYISVPLIESGLRQLLFQCDHSIYEENKHDGFENITLSRVLKTLEEYLKEDIIFHLKFILNEKAGLNLRNDLSHGLLGDSHINESTALSLLHILMILKLIVGFPSPST
ncbi:DUF4209 domain-containing protein [Peribacillus butanolivorans]|uniref:DUF4209 domain-containing protein n=1 Tax=Peribacillus butanolivorans TaxID=421767 RepID=UPI00364DAD24